MVAFRHFRSVDYWTRYDIDWNYDEDRSRIRTGHGPENITRLRSFAVGVLARLRKLNQSIAQMMRQMCFQPSTVLDYLRLTANSGQMARLVVENKFALARGVPVLAIRAFPK